MDSLPSTVRAAGNFDLNLGHVQRSNLRRHQLALAYTGDETEFSIGMSISNFGQESMPGLTWAGAVAKLGGIGVISSRCRKNQAPSGFCSLPRKEREAKGARWQPQSGLYRAVAMPGTRLSGGRVIVSLVLKLKVNQSLQTVTVLPPTSEPRYHVPLCLFGHQRHFLSSSLILCATPGMLRGLYQ